MAGNHNLTEWHFHAVAFAALAILFASFFCLNRWGKPYSVRELGPIVITGPRVFALFVVAVFCGLMAAIFTDSLAFLASGVMEADHARIISENERHHGHSVAPTLLIWLLPLCSFIYFPLVLLGGLSAIVFPNGKIGEHDFDFKKTESMRRTIVLWLACILLYCASLPSIYYFAKFGQRCGMKLTLPL